ncbi:MAG: acyloxyacyl hydrolase [Catalinimonas sp.]
MVCAIGCWSAAAQDTTETRGSEARSALVLGLRTQYGLIIPHSADIRDISNSNPWAAEVNLAWHLADDRYCRCYPRLGVSVGFVDFANPRVLGRGLWVVPYVEPFLTVPRRFSPSFRFGTGVVYLTNPFDAERNPDNLFYSTDLSFLLTAELSLHYRLDDRWQLRAGGIYQHISNGGVRDPNKGINFPMVTLGAEYALRPMAFGERPAAPYEVPAKRWTYDLLLVGSAQTAARSEAQRFALWGVAAGASYQLGRLNALLGGAEWIDDRSLREQQRRLNDDTPHQRGALLLGHALLVGRFRFTQQLGVYVWSPLQPRDPVYQRWGLDLRVSRRLRVGGSLKAHRQVADYIDARVGVVL